MRIRLGIQVHAEPGQLHATLACVRAHTAEPFELVVLADGPDDATRMALASLRDVPQLNSDDARGVAACFNRLTQTGAADVYVLLESGAQPAPAWLGRLLAGLAADARHGLAGPSTNMAWNEQAVFAGASSLSLAATALEAERRYGTMARPLVPLHSLADFCYVVRGEVIAAVGAADESYGLGPCWEMDYNVRAARAGFVGVWVGAAFVHRAPFTPRRRLEEARRFEASRRRYQDKFCARRLRNETFAYEPHCKGDACVDFAPPQLIRVYEPFGEPRTAPAAPLPPLPVAAPPSPELRSPVSAGTTPLISCIMPTHNRRAFVPHAIRYFLRQHFSDAELVILDDGSDLVGDLVPPHPRIRYHRLDGKRALGAKRNEACRLARGEIISHWDDDDWYAPSRLGVQLEALRAGVELCGSSQQYFYQPANDRAWRYQYRGGGAPMLVGTSLMYRKRLWQRSSFPEIQVGEDVQFQRAARTSVQDVADASLFVGVVHPGNTSPKSPDAVYWCALPPTQLHALLGADLASVRGLSAPLVSCIMPTRDRRRFVTLALDAFQRQAWPNRELIIVDDGNDAIADLAQLPDVRYIRLPRNVSIGSKRNLACAEARGQIIVHWDDDDWYGADRLTHQVAPIIAGEADLTGLENRFVLELPSCAFWTLRSELHRRMFVGDVHGGTLAFRRTLLDEGLRYPDANLAEDAVLIRDALRMGKRLLRLSNPGLFVYVRHGRNAWRFDVGRFLDPAGWQPTDAPADLPRETIAAYLAAAGS
jgi:glycosyltransferase involved in cell wall biosynthesis